MATNRRCLKNPLLLEGPSHTIVATRVGTNLDRYVIEAELGRGAMGIVYRAGDPNLGRTVAIKMVSTGGLDPEAEKQYRERFVVEAHAAGRLSHPGIVTIFDVREEAEPYLVMEYVEGQSLQQLMGRDNHPLPLSTTLRIIQEVAEALHYAHTRGVVHRDIKPANILVTLDGHPKIADFGIAKLNQTELTMPGEVLGSPAFMAPEQLSEEGVDSRSDLFSLGVILYYALTGYRPFQGNSTTTVCFKLVNHEPVPASALESRIPPELDKVIARAMAKDPAHRYQTGMAMAADLQTLRERSGFIHSSELTQKGLKGDTIPRYVRRISAELPTADRDSSEPRVEEHMTFEKKKAMSLTTVFVFGLAAMVAAGVALWSGQGPKPNPIAPTEIKQPVDNSAAEGQPEVAVAKESTINTSGHKSRKQPSPALASSSQSKAPIPVASAAAMLQIEVTDHFTGATVSVWVDNGLVYTQSLVGKKQRHALIFRKVVGHQFHVVRVTPGKHQVRVRVQSPEDSYDQSKITSVAFVQGVSLLRIICDDKNEGLRLEFKKDVSQ